MLQRTLMMMLHFHTLDIDCICLLFYKWEYFVYKTISIIITFNYIFSTNSSHCWLYYMVVIKISSFLETTLTN